MPQVQLIESQVKTQGVQPAQLNPNAAREQYIPQTGLTELASAVGKWQQEAKDRGDQVSLMEAQRKLDEWENKSLFDPDTGALARKGKDAFNLPNTLGPEFDKYGEDIFNGLANDDQKIAFKKMWYNRADNIQKTLYSHERSEMDKYAIDNTAATVDSAMQRGALYYNRPDVVQKSVDDARIAAITLGKVNGNSEQSIMNAAQEAESKVHLGVLTRMADADPKAAVDYYKANVSRFTAQNLLQAQTLMAPTERKYKATTAATKALSIAKAPVDTAGMINYVMTDLEGGDKVIIDNDGGTAKFGINSKGNGMSPDAVAALTPEQAAGIYKEKYWDAVGADDLPADMRLVAFDAAVQHGADDHTKKMIADANGDPRRLIEIRTEYYKQLAKDDPVKNGPYLEGWLNRMAKLTAQVDAMRGALPARSDLYAKIDAETDDVEVATDAKGLIDKQLDAIEEDRKKSWQAADDEAYGYVAAGMQVPASVEARMKPQSVLEMRNSNSAVNMEVYQNIRSKIITGQPITTPDGKPGSIADYRWQLGNKYDELVKLTQDPNAVVNARKVDDVLSMANQRLLGKKSAKTPADFARIETFRQSVQQEIDQLQSGGKVASGEDVQKIVDRKLLNADIAWGSDKKLFEATDKDNYTVAGIDRARQLWAKGKDGSLQGVTYEAVIGDIIAGLQARNLPLTPESIKKAYDNGVKKGIIVAKF